MKTVAIITENWLTHKPKSQAFLLTMVLTLLLAGLNYLSFHGFFRFETVLSANKESVFQHQHYWLAWTTLFIHADSEHFLSNLLLFAPLTYLLLGYYNLLLFPILGILLGGLINLIVLQTLPSATFLVGISGVVYWMGAAWLTLFVLIDRRKKLRYRLAVALFLSLSLFIPEKYHAEISYLSHFLGFVTGISSALIYYALNRKKFLAAERIVFITDDEPLTHDTETEVTTSNL